MKSNVTLVEIELGYGTKKITREEILEIISENIVAVKIADKISANLAQRALYYQIYEDDIREQIKEVIKQSIKVAESFYTDWEDYRKYIALKIFLFVDGLGQKV